MKTFWFSLGLVLALVAPAMAQDKESAPGWYIGTYGGANWDDVISAKGVSDNTGYVIGAVVGTPLRQLPGLRIEADMSLRQNDVDISFGGPFTINATHETFALMGNVVWDVPLEAGPIHPYALIGAGYAHNEGRFENISLASVENSGFAWQLGAGVNTELTDGIIFGVGYRYLQSPDISVFGTTLSDGGNHAVLVELKTTFN